MNGPATGISPKREAKIPMNHNGIVTRLPIIPPSKKPKIIPTNKIIGVR